MKMGSITKFLVGAGTALLVVQLLGCDGRGADDKSVRLATVYRVTKPTLGFKVRKVVSDNGLNEICLRVPNWVVWTSGEGEGWALMGVNKMDDFMVNAEEPEEALPLMSKYRLDVYVYPNEQRHNMGLRAIRERSKHFLYGGYDISLGEISPDGRFGTAISIMDLKRPFNFTLSIARGKTSMASRKVLAKSMASKLNFMIVSCEV